MKKLSRKTLLLVITIACLFTYSCNDSESDNLPTLPDENENKPELAYPNELGETIILNEGTLNEIFVEKFGDEYILSGDILLSDYQINQIKKLASAGQRTGLSDLTTRWPNCIVFYTINANLPNSNRVIEALNHWKATTEIEFIQRTSQNNYVEFVEGNGCSSYLGMIGGRQTITIGNDCTTGNTIHEIGHALGFFHEHQRTDRGNSVLVNLNNVLVGAENNFKTYYELGIGGYQISTLDFNSIMMYGSYAFSKNGLPTITMLNGTTFNGQRTALSTGDIGMIENMYNCTPTNIELNSSYGDMLGRSSALSSCSSQNKSGTYYFQRNSVWGLVPGDIIYINDAGTRLSGQNKWFKIGQLSYKINSSGVILQKDDCGVPY